MAAEHKVEEALEDAGEAVSGCTKALKKRLQDCMDKLNAGPHKDVEFVPPMPIGIGICTLVIAIGGFMMNSAWDAVDGDLAVFEERSEAVLEEFYASAAEAKESGPSSQAGHGAS